MHCRWPPGRSPSSSWRLSSSAYPADVPLDSVHPLTNVVAILLGTTLSRVIVGGSPAVSTLVASLVMVVIHRALAWACVHSLRLESLAVGVEREVFRDGQFNRKQMSAALITQTDVLDTARHEVHTANLDDVQLAILERHGPVSLIRKRASIGTHEAAFLEGKDEMAKCYRRRDVRPPFSNKGRLQNLASCVSTQALCMKDMPAHFPVVRRTEARKHGTAEPHDAERFSAPNGRAGLVQTVLLR